MDSSSALVEDSVENEDKVIKVVQVTPNLFFNWNVSESLTINKTSSVTEAPTNSKISTPLQFRSSLISKRIDGFIESENELGKNDTSQKYQRISAQLEENRKTTEDSTEDSILIIDNDEEPEEQITVINTSGGYANSGDENSSPFQTQSSTHDGMDCSPDHHLSYLEKRMKNNKACQKSRVKRKIEQKKLEEKVDYYIKDNQRLRMKIEHLESSLNDTRALLCKRLPGKS